VNDQTNFRLRTATSSLTQVPFEQISETACVRPSADLDVRVYESVASEEFLRGWPFLEASPAGYDALPRGDKRSVSALRDLGRAPYRLFGKRTIDATGAAILLVLLAPLMLLLAALVALDGGPPIFAHRRVGLHGRHFGCLKFRSMVKGAEQKLQRILAEDPALAAQWARDHKLDPDPRITWFGAFLRRSSLDELPQLWNVLRGDMSLIGPRPVTPAEISRYGVYAVDYESQRPGVSGLWQVSGRNDLTYDERVALDVRYARDVRLDSDVTIIWRTLTTVVRGTGK
jgi:exopolysaccharide production protein ExoY